MIHDNLTSKIMKKKIEKKIIYLNKLSIKSNRYHDRFFSKTAARSPEI